MPEIRSAADITAAPAAPISNGSLAESPIALAEVQGYVYGAKRAAAELARFLG
jgi:glycogen debranching enzyme